jgi:hypothetical protein
VRPEGDALQAQGRLRHLAVRDRGVALFGDLDLERGQLRDLLADPLEPFHHVLPKLIGDLDVATSDLDAHAASFVGYLRCYAARVQRTRGVGRFSPSR